MPDRAVVRRDDVLDLVGQERRRIDVARARAAEEERHLATVADRLIGEGANARDPENRYGIVRQDLRPKPAFGAFRREATAG